MKKAYLSISFQKRQHLNPVIEMIRKTAHGFQLDLFVFVDSYHYSPDQEKQMMLQAFLDIESANFLIAEVSEKSIGVGIEIGYAVALQKPVIYIRHILAEHSTTASGSSQYHIVYQNLLDLEKQLTGVFQKMNV
jgi:nucleoside 2-deoxyribosyltransferase